jgi:hypothetical protein
MVREVALDKIRSYGISKEEAEYIVEEIAKNHDLDKIYSLRVDKTSHTVKLEQTKLSADDLYKAAYVHLTSELFMKHNDILAVDAIKLLKLHKKQLEMQAMKEVLQYGESR